MASDSTDSAPRQSGSLLAAAEQASTIQVCALYKFATLNDYVALQQPLRDRCEELGLKGTILLAREGINGTVAGTPGSITALIDIIESDDRLLGIDYKFASSKAMPFYRMKVKLKKEIVTLGVETVDPASRVGDYVQPEDWNELIADPAVLLIDTRNDYEVEIGSFDGAVNPEMASFRDFPQFVERHCDPGKHKKVAMFCTGGIRCEKASSYLLDQGFEEVFHLKGGILNYLEQVEEQDSLWHGDCFVFDNRVTVDHALNEGNYDQCHACRRPVDAADKRSPQYEEGISCPRCYDLVSQERKQRFAERQKQIVLARQRKQAHIGAKPPLRQRKNAVK